MPVRPIAEHDEVAYDLMIVATLERSGNQVAALIRSGVTDGQAVSAPQGLGSGPRDDRRQRLRSSWL